MALDRKLKFKFGLTSPGTPTVFNDIDLDKPELTSPSNGHQECGTSITLVWGAVAGASDYIVQWCGNSSFTGPSLDAKKINAATTTTLSTGASEIVRGRLYYWRVFAFNSTGGASPKSDSRSFKLKCSYPHAAAGGSSYDTCIDRGVSVGLAAESIAVEAFGSIRIRAIIDILASVTVNSTDWVITEGDTLANLYGQTSTTCRVMGENSEAGGDVTIKFTLDCTDAEGNFTCDYEITVFVVPGIESWNPCQDLDTHKGPNNFAQYVKGCTHYEQVTLNGYDYYTRYPVFPFFLYEDVPSGSEVDFESYVLGSMVEMDMGSYILWRPAIPAQDMVNYVNYSYFNEFVDEHIGDNLCQGDSTGDEWTGTDFYMEGGMTFKGGCYLPYVQGDQSKITDLMDDMCEGTPGGTNWTGTTYYLTGGMILDGSCYLPYVQLSESELKEFIAAYVEELFYTGCDLSGSLCS